MQSANRQAPKILEALRVLGDAQSDHIAFALLGLPHALTTAAQAASQQLRPVAHRLKSRGIACELRIEMARLRAASAFPDASAVTWPELPWTDILPTVIFFVSGNLQKKVSDFVYHSNLSTDMEDDADDDYHGSRYAATTQVAQVCHACESAVRDWRRHERHITVYNADDMAVQAIARDATSAIEVQLYEDPLTKCSRVTGSVLADFIATGCPALQRLLVRGFTCTDMALSFNAAKRKPSLRQIDLVNTRMDDDLVFPDSISPGQQMDSDADLNDHIRIRRLEEMRDEYHALSAALPELRFIVCGCDASWPFHVGMPNEISAWPALNLPPLKCVQCARSRRDADLCICEIRFNQLPPPIRTWEAFERYGRSEWFKAEELALLNAAEVA